jgi:hypothetical protein
MKKMDFNSDAFYAQLAKLEKTEQTQVMPQSIFEHKTVLAAPIPYYEEMVRQAAAGGFSPLMQNSISKSDALKGIEGNPKVHDLISAHNEIMGVMSKEMKVKKAELKERLIVLCAQLRDGGKADLALQVEAQVEKLAEEERVSELAQVRSAIQHVFTLAQDVYESVARLPQEEFLGSAPKLEDLASAYKLAAQLKNVFGQFSVLSEENLKTVIETFKEIIGFQSAAVQGVSDLPANIARMMSDIAQILDFVKSLGGKKTSGLAQVAEFLNKSLPGLVPGFAPVSSASWKSVDEALKKYLGLYHASSKDMPAHGQAYSTLVELKQLMGKEVAELQAEKKKALDNPQEGGVNKGMGDAIKSVMDSKTSSRRYALLNDTDDFRNDFNNALIDHSVVEEGYKEEDSLHDDVVNQNSYPDTPKGHIKAIVEKLNSKLPRLVKDFKLLRTDGWTKELEDVLEKHLGLKAGVDYRNYHELSAKIGSKLEEMEAGAQSKPRVDLNAPVMPAAMRGDQMREELRNERVPGAGIQMGKKPPVSPFSS